MKRIISFVLAVMTVGFLFSACGKNPQGTPYTFRVAQDAAGEKQWTVKLGDRDIVSYAMQPADDGRTDVVFTGLRKGSVQATLYLAQKDGNVLTADNVYVLTLRVDARKNVTQSEPPYGAYAVSLSGDVSGSEWRVECDERIVHWKADREYPKKPSDEDGMQDFTQIYTFTGRRPGATRVRVLVDYPWSEGAQSTREDCWLLVDDEYRVSRLEPTDFVSFRIFKQGSSAVRDVYEAVRTDDGVRLSHYDGLSNWSDETNDYVPQRQNETVIDGGEALYLYLAGLLHACGVPGWDGFSGGNPPGVLDGTMFELEAELADGSTVHASGSNNYPDHFRDFWGCLYAVVYSAAKDGAQ